MLRIQIQIHNTGWPTLGYYVHMSLQKNSSQLFYIWFCHLGLGTYKCYVIGHVRFGKARDRKLG